LYEEESAFQSCCADTCHVVDRKLRWINKWAGPKFKIMTNNKKNNNSK